MTDLATRVTDAAAGLLDRRLGRRSFISRATLAGSAMTVAPASYVLRPVSAYAAICGCANQDCDCGQQCCDGYTEFCCTMTGSNACPPGSVVAGWWKADGSGLCGPGAPRYYMDCNAPAAGPCGSRGVTAAGQGCSCSCAGGNCDNRMQCCTAFRYGQCHQEIPCLGPIVCRVVTCAPPWQIDSSCSTTPATDNFTASHDAPCLHQSDPIPPPATGVLPLMVKDGRWYPGRERTNSPPAFAFTYGDPGDIPVAGDWNGDGITGPGVVRNGTWYLRGELTTGEANWVFTFGDPGDRPIVGDWYGDGISRPGVVRGNAWFLRNSHSSGPADNSFIYGDPGDVPVVGDWDGDRIHTPGVFRNGRWYLRNSNSSGIADIEFAYGGSPGDVPVVGDWNGDGVWGIGIVNGSSWFLRNTPTPGPPEIVFTFDLGDVDETGARWLTWTDRTPR